MDESWPEYDSTPPRERVRRGPDPLEQGLDRLVSAGRQLVDGVSGARPGSRTAARGAQRGGEDRRPGLDRLGRWVEDKIDWILDEDEDWREPWQEPAPRAVPAGRRPLEAISRRGRPAEGGGAQEDWPDDASFSIPRWQRQPAAPQPLPVEAPDPQPSGAARPLPRSTRRRRA
uniref:hypothetical protein n=1 Tax=Cyanobium sp. TaxID=2164130 RepID=UPI004049D1DD